MLTGEQLSRLADTNSPQLSIEYDEYVTSTRDRAFELAKARELAPGGGLASEVASRLSRDLIDGLALVSDLSLDGDLASEFASDLVGARDLLLNLSSDLDRTIGNTLDRTLNRNLDLALALAHDRTRTIGRDSARDRARTRTLDRELALAIDHVLAVNRTLNNDLALTELEARVLEVLSRTAWIIYVLLGAPYQSHIRPHPSTTVSPEVDIRSTGEDVARMVNRAVDEGMDDARIRMYDRWIQEGAGVADPEVIDELERRRIAAYEPVLHTLAGDTADDVIPALQAAAEGAPHDRQLHLITNNLEAYADQLEEIAARYTAEHAKHDPDVEPYLPKVLETIEHHADRTAVTLKRLNNAITQIAQNGGRAGRMLLNFSHTVGGGVAGAAAAAGAAVVGTPFTGVLRADVGALVGALFSRYLYARRRRTDPGLPPVNPPDAEANND